MSILEKLKKTSTIKESDVLSDSKFFEKKDMIPTSIPMLNVALAGRLDGGLVPGMTMFAGPSKHFKTAFSLMMVKAYMEKYPDAALLFYDSEFGAPGAYFDTFKIDTKRVLHTPVTDLEQLKFDITNQINAITRGDHVIIVIDSVGNLASKKEAEDALEGKSVGDMTRAKQIKSLFRIVTPHLTIKDIPLIVVNHTYMEMGMYPKAIVGGGTGPYYSADNIFIIGRQQEKENNELSGYSFILNVEKSRFVREKSKIPLSVSFEGGISPWSGLLEVALESGHVIKPKVGWYQRVNVETGEIEDKNYRAADTDTKEFWLPVLKSKSFRSFIESKYLMTSASIMQDSEIEGLYGDSDDE
jgi:RecA/RadA recombinase